MSVIFNEAKVRGSRTLPVEGQLLFVLFVMFFQFMISLFLAFQTLTAPSSCQWTALPTCWWMASGNRTAAGIVWEAG